MLKSTDVWFFLFLLASLSCKVVSLSCAVLYYTCLCSVEAEGDATLCPVNRQDLLFLPRLLRCLPWLLSSYKRYNLLDC